MKSFPVQSITEFLHVAPINSYNCLVVNKQSLRGLSYITPSLWDNLNTSLKTSVSLNALKAYLKELLFSGKVIKKSER